MAVTNLVNGGFEEPANPLGDWGLFPDASQTAASNHVPGWMKTASDHLIEIWGTGHGDLGNLGITADEGNQFAELNGTEVSTLYQDLETTPGTIMLWRLSHRGRRGDDTMALEIGPPGATVEQRRMTDGNTSWGHYQGGYTVPAGQTTTRFAFKSISAAGGDPTIGNFLDGIFFSIPVDPPVRGLSLNAWGWNLRGELGHSTVTTAESTPVGVSVPRNTYFTAIDAGGNLYSGGGHSLALDAEGGVWAWGSNAYKQLGSERVDGPNPQKVAISPAGLIVAIAAGGGHSLALDAEGGLWAWGWNNKCQLGDDLLCGTDRSTPQPVPGLPTIQKIAAGGGHSLALDAEGGVWAWGWNNVRQLGDDPPKYKPGNEGRPTPQPVTGLPKIQKIAAGGGHSLALDINGDVWAWGWNNVLQLGRSNQLDRTDSPTPEKVSIPSAAQIVAVAAGQGHSLALDVNGDVWAWGWNNVLQLGRSDAVDSSSPILVSINSKDRIVAISAGGGHSLVLDFAGDVWAWGWNNFSQLSRSDGMNSPTPQRVQGLANIKAIDAGQGHSVVIGN